MLKIIAITLTLGASLIAGGVASAQTLGPIMELCSNPLTTGPQKTAKLPQMGWSDAGNDPEKLANLATALIIGFTNGMPDLKARYGAVSQLSGNFANMIAQGQVSLWAKDDAVLAVSIAQTAEGLEHLACYFASPERDETMQLAKTYSEPKEIPELEIIGARFNEDAFTFNDDQTEKRAYKIYSAWTRITSNPARGPLTDGYRLERVEQPPSE